MAYQDHSADEQRENGPWAARVVRAKQQNSHHFNGLLAAVAVTFFVAMTKIWWNSLKKEGFIWLTVWGHTIHHGGSQVTGARLLIFLHLCRQEADRRWGWSLKPEVFLCNDPASSVSQGFHNLPKECHQLGIKCSTHESMGDICHLNHSSNLCSLDPDLRHAHVEATRT